MAKILIFLVFVHMFLTVHTEDLPDATMIFKVNNISGTEDNTLPVDVELHLLSNALGKLIPLDNKTFLSPVSSRDLPNFDCIYSNVPCQWWKGGSWTSSSITEDTKKSLAHPLDMMLFCEYDNGGCQVTCTNSQYGPVCSCPTGFMLNSDNKTCYAGSGYYYLLSSSSGSFISPYYSNQYPNNVDCKWLIVTLKDRRVRLHIPRLLTEEHHDVLTVYDGANKQLGRYYGSHYSINAVSTGNVMLVHFKTDSSVTKTGFSASYSTETNTYTQLSAIELNSDIGNITSSLNISKNTLCVSVINYLASSSSMNVTIEQSIGVKTNLTRSHEKKVNGWSINRFVLQNYNKTEKSVNFTIHLSGKNSKILNVAECTNNETDVYFLPSVVWSRNNTPQFTTQKSGDNKYCYNGGTYVQNSKICACPIGFTGNSCQEACGPNRYGENCSGVCSWLENGCTEMIFRNAFKSYMCATGLTGTSCSDECNPGTYGSNCANTCGRCHGDFCDIYTGECTACEEGYYPPLCQERYVTLKNAPNITEISWNNISISINFTNVDGKGSPYLYEVQYKEIEGKEWIRCSRQEIDSRSVVSANLTDLKVGTLYRVRVIIISEDGNSYQGSQIPLLEFATPCEVPDSKTYQIQSRNITSSSFAVEWKYAVLSDKWCPVQSYEIILEERWRKYSHNVSYEKTMTEYSNLLPGHQYFVYICAITRKGNVPCSFPFAVNTAEKAPGKVKNIIVETRNAKSIDISWKQPLFTGGKLKGYRVQYECVKYLICQDICNNSNGTMETNKTTVQLQKLLSHVQYKIKIAAFGESQGPYSEIFATTKSMIPDVSPLASEQPIISKSNTSVRVQWKPPHCAGCNGHLIGYYFTLCSEIDGELTIIQNGSTKFMHTNFSGLSPQTQYQIHVYAYNSHGWNAKYKLIIPFLTSATVPEAVQDLEVYKKGRRMLGIRWKPPLRTYGVLKSFTITYQQKDTARRFHDTITPKPCSGWPHLFCHTIDTNLRSDKQYIVTVRARNNEINEDGVAAEVHTITREYGPDAPSALTILRSTTTSFEMQWGLPNMFNGEIRSFIVNVEHIDSLNDSDCCDYFPVQELPFRDEMPVYELEVTGLLPASTYIISVAAKTITMGPSINATYYTAQLPPTDLKPPQVLSIGNDHSCLLKIQPSETSSSINSTYLLLVLPPEEKIAPIVWRRDLLDKMSHEVNHVYYIVTEFSSDELIDEQEVRIGTGREAENGTLAVLEDPVLSPGTYRVGLAYIQTYGNAVSVGLATSNTFEISDLPALSK